MVISKSGGTFKGGPLETEFYEVPQATINRMTGGTGGGMGGRLQTPLLASSGRRRRLVMTQASKSKPFWKVQESCLMMQKVINLFLMAFK